jgi:hypothetical protein
MSGCWRRSSMPARRPSSSPPGRHLHVHDRNIRPVREALAQQILRVPGLCDDLELRLGQQASNALAQQHVVLADYDP